MSVTVQYDDQGYPFIKVGDAVVSISPSFPFPRTARKEGPKVQVIKDRGFAGKVVLGEWPLKDIQDAAQGLELLLKVWNKDFAKKHGGSDGHPF